jgi:Flp pilus assembly protein TadG
MNRTAIFVTGGADRPARRRAGKSGDERGVVAVEFALVMPLLLLLVFGTIEFGFMLNRDMIVGNASRDGARLASLAGSYTEVRDMVESELSQSGIPTSGATTIDICVLPSPSATTCTNMTASAYDAAAISGAVTMVKVSYDHPFMTPFMSSFLGDSVSLEQGTQMRVE